MYLQGCITDEPRRVIMSYIARIACTYVDYTIQGLNNNKEYREYLFSTYTPYFVLNSSFMYLRGCITDEPRRVIMSYIARIACTYVDYTIQAVNDEALWDRWSIISQIINSSRKKTILIKRIIS